MENLVAKNRQWFTFPATQAVQDGISDYPLFNITQAEHSPFNSIFLHVMCHLRSRYSLPSNLPHRPSGESASREASPGSTQPGNPMQSCPSHHPALALHGSRHQQTSLLVTTVLDRSMHTSGRSSAVALNWAFLLQARKLCHLCCGGARIGRGCVRSGNTILTLTSTTIFGAHGEVVPSLEYLQVASLAALHMMTRVEPQVNTPWGRLACIQGFTNRIDVGGQGRICVDNPRTLQYRFRKQDDGAFLAGSLSLFGTAEVRIYKL